MPRPVHFEIHATDADRVAAFYTSLFGWRFQKWEGPMDYWLITTGPGEQPGINGGLVRRPGPSPVAAQAINAYVCTVDVPNVDEYVLRVGTLGGTVAMPKMAVPGIGWLAYAKDTDGNLFGMMQRDAGAK
jgi:uncharacterized protein